MWNCRWTIRSITKSTASVLKCKYCQDESLVNNEDFYKTNDDPRRLSRGELISEQRDPSRDNQRALENNDCRYDSLVSSDSFGKPSDDPRREYCEEKSLVNDDIMSQTSSERFERQHIITEKLLYEVYRKPSGECWINNDRETRVSARTIVPRSNGGKQRVKLSKTNDDLWRKWRGLTAKVRRIADERWIGLSENVPGKAHESRNHCPGIKSD